MYRIGLFSQITKVSIKALRFYEEKELLVPAFTDPATGYRYYDSAQLLQLHKIVSLRQCGFSIKEIRQLLDGTNAADLLESRRTELTAAIKKAGDQLAYVNSYITGLDENPSLKYQIVIKSLPETIVMSCRMTAPTYSDFFTLIPEACTEMETANPGLDYSENPRYEFIKYLDDCYVEHTIHFEYCRSVQKAGTNTDRVTFKVLDKVPRAVCTMHAGSYDGLPLAYCTLYKWIADNNMDCTDGPRETQIKGIRDTNNSADWLTEIQIPVRG